MFLRTGLGQYSQIGSIIQTIEGYFPGSTSYKNNNPGNLIASSWTQSQPGYIGQDANGFAVFDSLADGQAAEQALIAYYAAKGYTLQQMMSAWAPAGQGSNNPTAYAQSIATQLGISPSDPVTAAADGSSSGGGGDATLFSGITDPLSSLTTTLDNAAQSVGLDPSSLPSIGGVPGIDAVLFAAALGLAWGLSV